MVPSPPALTPAEADALAERLADDLVRRWRGGQRPLTEEYLARHPELAEHAEAVLELIYEEVCLRQEHGEPADPADVLARFPRWRPQLEALLGWHRLLQPALAPPAFPEAGETLGDFRLLAELGRGGRGRVFLAAQQPLADRPVVLKLTPLAGGEHLSLARLQHTHVVPLLSAHDFPERGLRGLSLPWFGGATLDRLLAALRVTPLPGRSGRQLLEVLDGVQRPAASAVDNRARRLLAEASFVQAVCWVGACVADALAYAHERGLLHLDLKPSNVLLAADGNPMLLDFHLALPPLAPGEAVPGGVGGTPAYAAPEHRAALEAAREGRPVPRAVDARADVFSLGVLLYEALADALPAGGETPAVTLRRRNHSVSPGLAAVIARCLAADPAARYPDAASVAADLRRHLDDLPLQGVPNRSLAERLAKWRRRRPYTPALFALLVAGLAAAGLTLDHFARQTARARAALAEGSSYLERRQYGEAAAALKRGLELAGEVPFQAELTGELRDRLRTAERAEAAEELHRVVQRLRVLDDAEGPPAEVRAVAELCRRFWQERDRIAERLGSQGDAELERRTRDDLLDLAILRAGLGVRFAPPAEVAEARREAVEVLDEAETRYGASAALSRERRARPTPPAPGLTSRRGPPGTTWLWAGRCSARATWEKPSRSWTGPWSWGRATRGPTSTGVAVRSPWGSTTTPWPRSPPAWRWTRPVRGVTTTEPWPRRGGAATTGRCATSTRRCGWTRPWARPP
jgi:eukaryotic-like serine/threonine-protein kinase